MNKCPLKRDHFKRKPKPSSSPIIFQGDIRISLCLFLVPATYHEHVGWIYPPIQGIGARNGRGKQRLPTVRSPSGNDSDRCFFGLSNNTSYIVYIDIILIKFQILVGEISPVLGGTVSFWTCVSLKKTLAWNTTMSECLLYWDCFTLKKGWFFTIKTRVISILGSLSKSAI